MMHLFRQPYGEEDLKRYLSQAVLPQMVHGPTAPPMPPEGHKAHRNHIAVRPERYRRRFVKIVSPKTGEMFGEAVKKFADTLPREMPKQPNVEERAGFALTIPTRGFKIPQTSLLYPSSIQDVAHWVMTYPLQTMTRAMHVAFPESRKWDVAYDNPESTDISLWNTILWRKIPPPPDPEKLWIQTGDPLAECSVVFVVQPPWILTPQDIKSFVRCTSLPPYISRQRNRPFTSAERIWAKLWDTCVRKQCHYWVISSYEGWVFGAFSEGYTAGQILVYRIQDVSEPTILECLIYHVAASMGLNSVKLPQYRETTWDLEQEIQIPSRPRVEGVEFPDSGSEWDGMDDEPGISAGVSASGSAILSSWGSESELCYPSTSATVQQGPTSSPNFAMVEEWEQQVEDDPPPFERELSPTPSESALSTAGIYAAAARRQRSVPRVKLLSQGEEWALGGIIATVIEQDPYE